MNEELLNLALAITQQFGPERAKPREERLKKANPDIASTEAALLFEKCDEIERIAYQLAEKVRDKEITMEQFSKKLHESYPELNEARLSKTVSQAMYFSLK
ncbi:hypothetical protein [Pseudomonas abyssi]|uniref:hypothetical protein n=1 Tax=Pseudomonas abyssi TaxID=170540 RepID=UPI003C79F2B0